MNRQTILCCLAAPIFASGLCVMAQPAMSIEPSRTIQAQAEIPEESLVDVAIEIFDPGLPDPSRPTHKHQKKGVFNEVRMSEARFIPFELKQTLQSTGQWGAVRVVPTGTSNVDLTISGMIVVSTGKDMVLALRAVDVTGREWLEKRYKHEAEVQAYLPDQLQPHDPYQPLYNRIANDLLAARKRLTDSEVLEIRQVAQLKFAADLAPTAFAGYLEVDRKGRAKVERLPAANDPMMIRIADIRQRDYMLVDTLNEHYATFCIEMQQPYDDWRAFSYEEQVALEELRRAARWRKILGALAIFGAVVADADSSAERAARDAAMIGGAAAIRSGMAKAKEAKMHVEALRELGASFDAEVAPLVVEVEGQTLRLSGSAETQYENWRKLLREIYATETGLPLDPNTQPRLAVEKSPAN